MRYNLQNILAVGRAETGRASENYFTIVKNTVLHERSRIVSNRVLSLNGKLFKV